MYKSFIATGFVFLAGAGVLYGFSRAQDVIDWWRLRDYTPSLAVEALADNAGFSQLGDKLFYVHDPLLLDKQTFADRCDVGKETIVLGCYISHQRIYIFDVQDERLEGVEEVTAAHEMLHAAYDRLSEAEREMLDQQLLTAFAGLEADPEAHDRIIRTVQGYEKRDPSIVPNELHSILGIELAQLPEALEAHYANYFADRSKVVLLAEEYAEEFDRREVQIEAFDSRLGELEVLIVDYDTQLDSLKQRIGSAEGAVAAQDAVLQEQQAELERLLDSDPDKYNQSVDGYNALVAGRNRAFEELRGIVNEHNSIVGERNELLTEARETLTERNAIAVEERELVGAIDTRVDEL